MCDCPGCHVVPAAVVLQVLFQTASISAANEKRIYQKGPTGAHWKPSEASLSVQFRSCDEYGS